MSTSLSDEILRSMNECTVAICGQNKLIGSGVIVSPSGLVVTCKHVIDKARDVSMKIGPRQIPAEVYKKDKKTDLAILRIANKDVRNYVYIEKFDKPKQGQTIFVLGFPLGGGREGVVKCDEIGSANLSKGVVSNISKKESDITDFIHIDASVDRGNSGGPVFDENGNIIGFVTTELFEGMACCIPTNTLLLLLPWYEFGTSTLSLIEYAERETDKYRSWPVFKHYVNLKCSIKDGDKQDLLKYVLDVWLPDKSKSLLALLGEFGSGKTLFCHKLTYELFKDYKPGKKLPFLVKLRTMREYKYESLKDLLIDQFETKLGLSNLTWFTFEEILRSGEIILIYDGFEEMTMKAGAFQMSENFSDILSTIIPGAKTIVTCRTHYFSTEKETDILATSPRSDEIEGLIKYESDPDRVSIAYLESLEESDIRTYLESKLSDWKNLYDKLNDPDFYNLADLAKRPIFLDVIVETIPNLEFVGKKITRTRLYQLYTEMCFEREAHRIGFSPEQQSQIIEELAFEVYKQKFNYFDWNMIEVVWSGVTGDKPKNNAVEQFIRKYPFLRKIEQVEGKLDFIHQSFFEFFVAKRISRSIHKRYHNLYATEYLTSPIDGYLGELLESNDDIGVILVWLERHPDLNVRMNCALTLGRYGKSEFVPVLRECLEKDTDIGVAGRIADALASLGDEESRLKFLENLAELDYSEKDIKKSEDHRLLYEIVGPLEGIDSKSKVIDSLVKNLANKENPRIRKYAAFFLGRTRSKRGVPGLIKLLTNPKETVRARRYAAAALGIIGSSEALPILSALSNKLDENEFIQQECSKAASRIKTKINELF